jgi:hypothetical protein
MLAGGQGCWLAHEPGVPHAQERVQASACLCCSATSKAAWDGHGEAPGLRKAPGLPCANVDGCRAASARRSARHA